MADYLSHNVTEKKIQVKDENQKETSLTMKIHDAPHDNNMFNLLHLFLRGTNCAILVYSINS